MSYSGDYNNAAQSQTTSLTVITPTLDYLPSASAPVGGSVSITGGGYQPGLEYYVCIFPTTETSCAAQHAQFIGSFYTDSSGNILAGSKVYIPTLIASGNYLTAVAFSYYAAEGTVFVIVPFTIIPTAYTITFEETGLPTGTPWGVTVGGTLYTSTSTSNVVTVTSGLTVPYTYNSTITSGSTTFFTASLSCTGSESYVSIVNCNYGNEVNLNLGSSSTNVLDQYICENDILGTWTVQYGLSYCNFPTAAPYGYLFDYHGLLTIPSGVVLNFIETPPSYLNVYGTFNVYGELGICATTDALPGSIFNIYSGGSVILGGYAGPYGYAQSCYSFLADGTRTPIESQGTINNFGSLLIFASDFTNNGNINNGGTITNDQIIDNNPSGVIKNYGGPTLPGEIVGSCGPSDICAGGPGCGAGTCGSGVTNDGTIINYCGALGVVGNAPPNGQTSSSAACSSLLASNNAGLIIVTTSAGTISASPDPGPSGGISSTICASSCSAPFGFLTFTVTGLTLGETITVSITYPSAVPSGAIYLKYSGATEYDATSLITGISGNTISLSLTDGLLPGDLDGTQNGQITDPSGLLSTTPIVPTPVFPFGTVLAVIVPLLALALFSFGRRQGQQRKRIIREN